MPASPKFRELEGQRFGRLVAIERIRKEASGKVRTYWLCKCDCGNETEVRIDRLREDGSHTNSCGCIKDELFVARNYKHGQSKTQTYSIWEGMKDRCNNPKSPAYCHYGGRGITVCDRWNTYENFLADMGERPERMTLDRINNNGNYEPSNCRWTTMKEQGNNKRDNRIIECNGKSQTLQQWSDEIGIQIGTIVRRLNLGWSIPEALFSPIIEKYRRKDCKNPSVIKKVM